MDNNNWRTQFQPDSRQQNVNTIMDSLKRFRPSSSREISNELEIAKRFEEYIFTTAKNQSDYEQKIWMKILTIETKPQSAIPNSLHPGSLGMNSQSQNQTQQQSSPQNTIGLTNSESQMSESQQTVNLPDQRAPTDTFSISEDTNEDWQEEVYQKIKQIKDQYLPELSKSYQRILDSLKQKPTPTQLNTLNEHMFTTERAIEFLQVSKSNILPWHKAKLTDVEKEIIKIIDKYRPVSQNEMNSSSTEKPIDRLMKAVNSIQSKALSSSVSDIGSVIMLMDIIAESGPGNGSRNAIGEDLVSSFYHKVLSSS